MVDTIRENDEVYIEFNSVNTSSIRKNTIPKRIERRS